MVPPGFGNVGLPVPIGSYKRALPAGTTDASGYAIGGVLSQGPIGKDLLIAYAFRLLNPAEQKYSTIEKECLAIVYCTMHFRPYLYGRKFAIVTDHKPLVWMNSIEDPTSRIWKWKLKLSDLEFDIQYKERRTNANADALSRNPPGVCLPIKKREGSINIHQIDIHI